MCSSTLGLFCAVLMRARSGWRRGRSSICWKKGLASQDGGIGSCLVSRGGKVGLINSRHGMGTPGGAHAGQSGQWPEWPEMTRIKDCSAGLGCFEERVGMSGHEQARARQTSTYNVYF